MTSKATILKSAMCRTRVFHRPAPQLFYFPGISNSKPVYTCEPAQFTNSHVLQPTQQQLDDMLKEYRHLRTLVPQTDYKDPDHKLHKGTWDWNSFILKGKIQPDFIKNCPRTLEFLENFRHYYGVTDSGVGSLRLMTDTPFSFAFFSTLHAGGEIGAHYGPCNLRLRCHLPLIVPVPVPAPAPVPSTTGTGTNKPMQSGSYDSERNESNESRNDDGNKDEDGSCGMEIGGEVVKWEVGNPLLFDDCYEHRVWNNSTSERVVLLFDIWHPDLHNSEIDAIVDMFQEAKHAGWLS